MFLGVTNNPLDSAMVTKQLADLSAKTTLISDSMTQLSLAGPQIAVQQRTVAVENEMQYIKMITEAVVSQVMDADGAKARLLKPYLQAVIQEVINTEYQRANAGNTRKERFAAQKPLDTTLSHGKLEPSSWSSNTVPTHHRLEVLRAHQATTVYHSAWIGTVTVCRKTSASKAWRESIQKYETEMEASRAVIQIKFAPWISNTRLDLNLDKLLSLGRTPSFGVSVETVKYSRVPPLVYEAIHRGDVNYLCKILVENGVSPKDRSTSDGRTLLDLSLVSLALESVDRDGPTEALIASRIVNVALWLLSQGIETKEDEADQWMKYWLFQLGMMDISINRDEKIRNMEQLLMKSTSNSPPLARARVLVLFAMLNPEHSGDLDCAVWDMIHEGADQHDFELLQRAADGLWKSETHPFGIGMESVVILSILQLLLTSPRTVNRVKVLKGPRRLILDWLSLMDDPYSYEMWPKYIASILRICRSMDILNDGFGDVVAKFACQRHLLGGWLDALKLANYSAASSTALAEHLIAEIHIQPSLSLTLSYHMSDNQHSSANTAVLTAADPHGPLINDLQHSLNPLSGIYSSQASLSSPAICQVRHEGTELHFDCDITHADFPTPNPWTAERQHCADLDVAVRHFTGEEPRKPTEERETEMELFPIVAPASNSLLSLASQGIAFLAGVS